jgi:hypothetical protein
LLKRIRKVFGPPPPLKPVTQPDIGFVYDSWTGQVAINDLDLLIWIRQERGQPEAELVAAAIETLRGVDELSSIAIQNLKTQMLTAPRAELRLGASSLAGQTSVE